MLFFAEAYCKKPPPFPRKKRKPPPVRLFFKRGGFGGDAGEEFVQVVDAGEHHAAILAGKAADDVIVVAVARIEDAEGEGPAAVFVGAGLADAVDLLSAQGRVGKERRNEAFGAIVLPRGAPGVSSPAQQRLLNPVTSV